MAVVHRRDLDDDDLARLGIGEEPTEVQKYGICPQCGQRMGKRSDKDRCYRDRPRTDRQGNYYEGQVRCLEDVGGEC